MVLMRVPGQRHGDASLVTPRLTRRRALLVAGMLGTAPILTGCGGKEGRIEANKVLSISLNQTESHPSYIALSRFGDLLHERTNGRWGARVYANENLGAQQEVVQLVADGSVDMAVISSPQMENLSTRFRPLNLPGVFTDIAHQNAVLLDESVVGELFTSLVESNNLRVLGGFTQGARNLYTSTEVTSPKDLAGKKIRVQESDVFLELIRAMGGSPTPMAYGEVYTALQAGVLDGAENNEVSYVTQRHNEVATYYTMTRHLVGLDYIVAGERTLSKMSSSDRDIFTQTFQDTQQYFVDLWDQETKKSIEQMKAAGNVITDVAPEVFGPAIDSVAEKFLNSDDDRELYRTVKDHSGAAREEAQS